MLLSDQPMRILHVEDNAMYRDLVRGFLCRNLPGEYEIFECASSDDAISVYNAVTPDWILMDIMAGVSDGLTAARRIREINPEARIVMLTQYNERAYRNEASALGAEAYVLKENLDCIIPILTSDKS